MSEEKKASFTPGPWDYDEEDFTIYQLETMEPIPDTAENARLKAAAPELLAALQDAERILSNALMERLLRSQIMFDATVHINGIRAAIAKAKGE